LHSSCTLRVVASMWLWCVTTRTGRPGEGQPSTALQCRLLTAVRPCGGRTSAAACNHRRRCCGEVSCHGNRKLLSCEISRSLGAHQGVGRDPQRPGARSGPHSAGMFVQFRGFNPPNHRQLCRSGTVAAPQGITVFAWVSVVNGPNRPASPSPATGRDTTGPRSRTLRTRRGGGCRLAATTASLSPRMCAPAGTPGAPSHTPGCGSRPIGRSRLRPPSCWLALSRLMVVGRWRCGAKSV